MAKRKDETLAQYNARMNDYMKSRYFLRREEAIKYLGGKCVDCGFKEHLEFDHKIPDEKEYNIGQMLSGWSWDRIKTELDKCELRCISCHAHVTAYQRLQKVDVLGIPL